MTPEQFEGQTLGVALACVAFAGVIALLVYAEWQASRTFRERRNSRRVGQ